MSVRRVAAFVNGYVVAGQAVWCVGTMAHMHGAGDGGERRSDVEPAAAGFVSPSNPRTAQADRRVAGAPSRGAC